MTRPPVIRLYEDEGCIDGFAGGGGTSKGIEMAIGRSPDVAINHNDEALAMHLANHPETRHIHSNIRTVRYERVLNGKRCGFAWFSPDCTFHSKARGGKPFRDRDRARRLRGLAWEAVRCAEAIRPRIIFVENVEEFQDWCPLGANGIPLRSKKGASFVRWVARLRNFGYIVDWRQLRACDFGAPTSRRRLFVIARCDGKPIVWPAATHGPHLAQPYRTAAECIDWSLPVPSIFLTPEEAKEWAKARGMETPRRPLADATLRRIARGIQRFVLDAAQPFIVNVRHHGGDRVYSLLEPARTIPASDREVALVTPFLTPYYTERQEERHARTRGVDEPLPTITASGGGKVALLAPTLIQVGYGERQGQAPRVLDLHKPLGTIVGGGMKHALVAAFLAKHNGGHEATGQTLFEALHAITTVDQKALVTSHLVKLYGTCKDGQTVDDPMPTVTASGNHIAQVSAFLVKFYGNGKDGQSMKLPIGTVTTKDRFGLVTVSVAGEEYIIADIGMRMLTPRELFSAQGFPADYQIANGIHPTTGASIRFTKKAQTRLCGNSVSPHHAAALISANLAEPAA